MAEERVKGLSEGKSRIYHSLRSGGWSHDHAFIVAGNCITADNIADSEKPYRLPAKQRT